MLLIESIPTPRMLLRTWRESDLGPLARMCADPRVMEFFPKTLAPSESYELYRRITAHYEVHGFCPWAVEIPGVTEFAGWTGLSVPTWDAPFMPCVEIGWRFAFEFWGKGYATEAANASLDAGFNQLGLKEIVSFTSPLNVRSIRVMERIGMTRDPSADFHHPAIPKDHPLSLHVLYRKQRPAA